MLYICLPFKISQKEKEILKLESQQKYNRNDISVLNIDEEIDFNEKTISEMKKKYKNIRTILIKQGKLDD